MTNKNFVQLLQESEQFTKMIVSIIEEGIIVCDHDFQIQIWNKFVEDMVGLSSEHIHNQWVFTLFPQLASPPHRELFNRSLLGETVLLPDFIYQEKDPGEVKWYRGKISPQIGINGETLGIVLLFTNITNEKEAAEVQHQLTNALQNQRMLSESLGRIIFANTISTSLNSLLGLICQESAFLFNALSVQIWLRQEEGIVKIAEYGGPAENTAHNQRSIASKVIKTKKPYWINDAITEKDLYQTETTSLPPPSSLMAVPLIKGEHAIGTLIILNRPFHQFSTYDLEIALQFGGYAAIAVESARLYKGIINANEKLIQTYDSTLAGWAKALELRDRETEGHTQRVTNGTVKLARAIGVNEEEIVHIYRGALLHDIGKMGIPDNILRKPGNLSEEEWKIMRLHPVYAYEWLRPIEYLHKALEIPYCHHEKWDGTGYPRGLQGTEIPLSARIFSVIDVWDALSFDRPYRKAWNQEQVRDYIQTNAGHHFDPDIVANFLLMTAL